jgi:hypothetical protein
MKGKRKIESDFKQKNVQMAINWRLESPRQKRVQMVKSQHMSEVASAKREDIKQVMHKLHIFNANKWDIIKKKKKILQKRLDFLLDCR